eukprot:12258-Heterococcus_DN1.PRE.2
MLNNKAVKTADSCAASTGLIVLLDENHHTTTAPCCAQLITLADAHQGLTHTSSHHCCRIAACQYCLSNALCVNLLTRCDGTCFNECLPCR